MGNTLDPEIRTLLRVKLINEIVLKIFFSILWAMWLNPAVSLFKKRPQVRISIFSVPILLEWNKVQILRIRPLVRNFLGFAEQMGG